MRKRKRKKGEGQKDEEEEKEKRNRRIRKRKRKKEEGQKDEEEKGEVEEEMIKRSRNELSLVVPTLHSQFTTRSDINNCICLHNAFKSRMIVTRNDRSFSSTALTNGSL
jgi:hypothetical protein